MKAKKITAPEAEARTLAVKGFDRDLKCRGYQYAIGETYQHKGRVVACESGFHACEMPLDVFSYYPLSTSRYASVVALGDVSRQENSDSKIASGRLYVEAEIKLPDIIKRAVSWVMERAKGNTTTGNGAHAAATGDRGNAAATGYSGHAAATGKWGVAVAIGGDGTAQAGETGAIVLAHWAWEGGEYKRKAIGAFEVGTNGVEPGKTYRLNADGKPEEVA